MSLERLFTRVILVDENDNEIVYLYNREALDVIELVNGYDGKFIQVNGELTFRDKKYIINKINFKLHPAIYTTNYGISETEEITASSDYNVSLYIFLREKPLFSN